MTLEQLQVGPTQIFYPSQTLAFTYDIPNPLEKTKNDLVDEVISTIEEERGRIDKKSKKRKISDD